MLVTVLSAFAIVWFKSAEEPAPVQPDVQFPVGGSAGPSTGVTPPLTLAGQTGAVVVENFIENGSSLEDPANGGNYYLAGSLDYCEGDCAAIENEQFSIVYFSKDQAFGISLSTEPLGEVRRSAERYLMGKLGINEAQMCELRYTLGTTVYVNPTYGSMENLGFSFCPGSTQLPG